MESQKLYTPRKNIQRKSTQRKSITPSINYAIEVIVFGEEKQQWETMNWELQSELIINSRILMLRELIINSRILMLICKIHDTLVFSST